MNGARHAAISQMLVETAEALAQPPRTALAAGELLWGAACHGLAAAERHPDAPTDSRARDENCCMSLTTCPSVGKRNTICATALRSTQRKLHDNFYTGRLSDDELAYEIRVGVDFVRNLLHVSNRS